MTRHDRGVKLLIEEFGAEVCVTYRAPELDPVGKMATARVRVNRVAEERGGVIPRWPMGLVGREARYAVLSGRPMDQRSASYFRAGIAGVGGDPSEVAWLHAVPYRATIDPSVDELREWRDWCFDSIAAANVTYVLLSGTTAVKCWRGDLTVTHAGLGSHGTGVGIWKVRGRDILVAITLSALAVLRDRLLEQSWHQSLGRWEAIVGEGAGIDALGTRCVAKCGEFVWAYDSGGIPWCRRHWRDDGEVQTRRRLSQSLHNQALEGLEG